MQTAPRPSGEFDIVKGPGSIPGFVEYCAFLGKRRVLRTEIAEEYDGAHAAPAILGYLEHYRALLRRSMFSL